MPVPPGFLHDIARGAHGPAYEAGEARLFRDCLRPEVSFVQSDPQAILDAALRLSENERLAIVSRLLETLPPEDITVSLDDPQLVEELDRRFADNEGTIPWSDLKAEG